MTEDKCPECGGELRLYTKPDGNFIACQDCPWTQEALHETAGKEEQMSLQLPVGCRCGKHIAECFGYGSFNPKFMFIGLSAGKLGALITKVPFTKDGSGRLLQRMLGTFGFSKSDEFSIKPELKNVYITNLAKGRYLDDMENNRLPTDDEIHDWYPYLEKEIEKVQPEFIVALGKLVYDSLFDNYPHLLYAKHPRWYFSHGAVNKKGKWWKIMVKDYAKILEIKGF